MRTRQPISEPTHRRSARSFLLRDMDRAVARIAKRHRSGEPIEIHGDYDVDGVTSTVVLKKALELIGVDAAWHIPHRLHDGYGMQPAAVEEAAARGVRLIISVDNGIRATAAIARGLELGVETIVTDHHLPEAELPPAVAIVNPNRADCSYPNPNLCGAGVAFKLAHAILSRAGWPERGFIACSNRFSSWWRSPLWRISFR